MFVGRAAKHLYVGRGTELAFARLMHHQDLLAALCSTGSFATTGEAQRALLNTFENLGYALPTPLLRELSALLPRSYASALWIGPSCAEAARRLAHAQPAWNAEDFPGPLLDEMHVVCGALAELLPGDLAHRLGSALPKPLAKLFVRPPQPVGKRVTGTVQVSFEHVANHQDRSSN